MKRKSLIRDAGVLIAFCGAFYLLVTLVNRWDGGGDDDGSGFSQTRLRADELFYSQNNYADASAHYARLTTEDPHNGHAWAMLATSQMEERSQAIRRLRDLEQAGLGNMKSGAAQIEAAYAEIELRSAAAYETFQESQRFLRHQKSAFFWMATIDTFRGADQMRRGNAEQADQLYQTALDHLESFVEGGHTTQHGLDALQYLGDGGRAMAAPGVEPTPETRLHFEPRFWDLVARERINRIR